MKEYPVTCHCGSPAHLHSNAKLYGREFGKVPYAYICDTFPACRGSVGVHPNGKPLGTIPDEATKVLRRRVHALIDPLWQNQPYQPRRAARGQVYAYMRKLLGMTAEECHIGNFDAETCERLITLMEVQPYELLHR